MQSHYIPASSSDPYLYTLRFVSQSFNLNRCSLHQHSAGTIRDSQKSKAKPEIIYCYAKPHTTIRTIKVTTAKNFLLGYVLNRKYIRKELEPFLTNEKDIDDYLQSCIANKVPHLTSVQMDLYNRNYSIRS